MLLVRFPSFAVAEASIISRFESSLSDALMPANDARFMRLEPHKVLKFALFMRPYELFRTMSPVLAAGAPALLTAMDEDWQVSFSSSNFTSSAYFGE